MPIKGLTDEARFPTIGVLRKGAPKDPNSNEPGRDLSFFRFTSQEPGLEQVFLEAYGAEPRSLEVCLPYATADECFEAWMEEYVASAMLRRCDGEACVLWRERDGTMSNAERACAQHATTPCKCKETGRLSIILPELDHLSVVLVTTTSVHDIRNLYGSLKRYEQVARTSGSNLMGIPFTLKRVPRRISTPGKGGGRARREKYLLAIEPSSHWVHLQLKAAKERALAPVSRQLTDGQAPEQVDTLTGEIIVEGTPSHRRIDGSRKAEVQHVQQELLGPSAMVLKEVHTAASDFGFTSDMRRLRVRLAQLITDDTSVRSFKDLTDNQAAHLQEVLDELTQKLPDESRRLAFARYCVVHRYLLSSGEHITACLGAFEREWPEDVDWNDEDPRTPANGDLTAALYRPCPPDTGGVDSEIPR